MKRLILLTGVCFLLVGNLIAQKHEEARAFFRIYMQEEAQLAAFEEMLPGKKECKMIFEPETAKLVHKYYRNKWEPAWLSLKTDREFTSFKVESFTTEDVRADEIGYALTLGKLKYDLLPKVVFYKVSYFTGKQVTLASSYKYFVQMKGKWVYLPKPWKAVKKTLFPKRKSGSVFS